MTDTDHLSPEERPNNGVPTTPQREALVAILNHRSVAKGKTVWTLWGFILAGRGHAERLCHGRAAKSLYDLDWIELHDDRYVTVTREGMLALTRCTHSISAADRLCYEAWAVAMKQGREQGPGR